MPTKPKQYRKLQFQILKEIALNGHLSNRKLRERLEVSHPVISEAIKSLMDRRLVEISYIDSTEPQGGKPEKYYTLTKQGLEEFISRIPAPEEFFQALLKSYNLRLQTGWLNTSTMSIKDFELHHESYKQKYFGYSSTHAYVIQSSFFNKIYEQWLAEYRPGLFSQYRLKNIIDLAHSPFIEKCYEESLKINDYAITIVQKVLECLAIHRSITEKQIEEYLNSNQKFIEEKLGRKISKYPDFYQGQIEFHCAITPANIKRVIERYTLSESHMQDELKQYDDAFDYDGVVKKYLEYLSRLAIVRTDCAEGPRYELSLLGVMLTLAIVTHPHQQMFYKDNEFEKNNIDLVKFYSIVSQNYADKLPLIFGKWALLTRTREYAYEWFLPVLYQNIEDEFARAIRPGPVTVTLGGVKEFQETMQEIAFHTTVRLFDLCRGLSSVLSDSDPNENPEIPLIRQKPGLDLTQKEKADLSALKQRQKAGLLALEQKQNELAALLKYADLDIFIHELKDDNKNPTHLELVHNSELSIIEKALASEINFLFYINLARNRFLDYTDEGRNFLGDERDTGYRNRFLKDDESGDTIETHISRPVDYLRTILKTDIELKNMFQRWIADIMLYRRHATENMEKFEETVKKWKSRAVGNV